MPRTFRTADPYRIFIRKDGITWQGNTGNSLLSSARKQPGMVVETSRPIADVPASRIHETSLGNWVRAYREKLRR